MLIFKKHFNILIATLIVVLCANIPSLAQFTGGGTSASPYLLLSRADMDTLVKYVETESNWTAGKYFRLMVDIGNLSGPWTKIIGIYSPSPNANMFQGHFDGNGKKIYLNINNAGYLPAGLFSQVVNGSVKNLTVQGSVTGGLMGSPLGGIVGVLVDGNIDNCTNSATILGSESYEVGGIAGTFLKINTSENISISNCKDSGSVTGAGAGGIVGLLNVPQDPYPAITNCINYGIITGTSVFYGAGGMCCFNQGGLIANSVNVGSINAPHYAGGIISINNFIIERCINLGTVSGTTHTGGIAGFNTCGGKVDYCMNAGQVNGGSKVGGICGYQSVYPGDPPPKPPDPLPPPVPSQTTYCLNVGVVEGADPPTTGGIVGAKINSPDATILQCYYDKQFTFWGGLSDADVTGQAEGRNTSEMIGSELGAAISPKNIWSFSDGNYPIISALSTNIYAQVASSPAILDEENLRNSINKHFSVSMSNGVDWTSRNSKIAFTSGNAKLNLTGLDTIMCSKGDARKLLPIWILSVPNEQYYDLIVEAEPSVGGVVTGTGMYLHNTRVIYTADPNPYYTFMYWEALPSGNIISYSAKDSILVTSNITLRAHFAIDSFWLTLSASPDYMGSVMGTGLYAYGYNAMFWAVPNYGYHFVKWTDDSGEIDEIFSETEHNYIEILEDRQLTAHFEIDTFQIKISVEHHSYGLANINDTISDSARFVYLTPVKLDTKGYDTCFHFVKWTSFDDPTTTISTDPEFVLTLTCDTHIVAHYTESDRYVYLNANIPEAVAEFIGDGAFPCMPFATTEIDFVMNEGYRFISWTEDETGKIVTLSPLTNFKFEVSKTSSFTANFVPDSVLVYIVTLLSVPENGGELIGAGAYFPDDEATIIAEPNTDNGFRFINWRRDDNSILSNNPTESIIVTQDTTLRAYFSNEYYFNRSIYPNESAGYFTAESSSIGSYAFNDLIKLEAIPNDEWEFIHWSSGSEVITENPILEFFIKSDTSIVAEFDYVGITELPEVSSFILSPNPTSKHFTMSLDLLEDAVVVISLHDLTGNNIMQINDEFLLQGLWDKEIDVSKLPSGSYYVKVTIGNNSRIEKLMIER
ncbi:MAG: T9SS type A sorting domain-containing protein [Bacteroidetes bacterium]|nr:T9SS type A sorting domain-containing protein [Bacteroidota bacterium]